MFASTARTAPDKNGTNGFRYIYGSTKMTLANILKRQPHNTTSFTLNFKFKSNESTSWIEHIFITCTQMKTVRYLTSAHFRSPSKASIDANVPFEFDTRNSYIESVYNRKRITCYLFTSFTVSSSLDMLLNSFSNARLNTESPQSHYSSVVDVFGKKALLEIYDGLSDKTRYLVDIEHENEARRE
ncbi:hypothetical protein AB4K20DRAFT_1945552 [Rhizopus microsporus]